GKNQYGRRDRDGCIESIQYGSQGESPRSEPACCNADDHDENRWFAHDERIKYFVRAHEPDRDSEGHTGTEKSDCRGPNPVAINHLPNRYATHVCILWINMRRRFANQSADSGLSTTVHPMILAESPEGF